MLGEQRPEVLFSIPRGESRGSSVPMEHLTGFSVRWARLRTPSLPVPAFSTAHVVHNTTQNIATQLGEVVYNQGLSTSSQIETLLRMGWCRLCEKVKEKYTKNKTPPPRTTNHLFKTDYGGVLRVKLIRRQHWKDNCNPYLSNISLPNLFSFFSNELLP